jgi:hypothetical protein
VLAGFPVTTINELALDNYGVYADLPVVTIPASVTELALYAFGSGTGPKAIFFDGNAPHELNRQPRSSDIEPQAAVPPLPASSSLSESPNNEGLVYVPVGSTGWDGDANSTALPEKWRGRTIRHYSPEERMSIIRRLVPDIRQETVAGITYSFTVVDGKAEIIGGRDWSTRHGGYWMTDEGQYYPSFKRESAIPVAIEGSLIIPSSLGGYPVTSLGDWAFTECYNLASITVPEGVLTIGSNAFNGCSKLKFISLPNSLRALGDGVLDSCNMLTSCRLPKYVSKLGSWNFYWCRQLLAITVDKDNPHFADIDGVLYDKNVTKLIHCPLTRKELVIPEGVVTLPRSLLDWNSELSALVIPKSVVTIDRDGWSSGKKNLSSIVVADGNPAFIAVDNVLYDRAMKTLLRCAPGKAGVFVIPSGVTEIAKRAFADCEKLTGITIPESVNQIQEGAFSRCSEVVELIIPSGVDDLGLNAFEGCTQLTQVFFAGNVPRSSDEPFRQISSSDKSVVTVYYRPGTKGWEKTFGGRPTAVWKQ